MSNKYEREVREVGRPSKFTPERRNAILEDISNRIPYALAAEANGICEETLYDWLKHGLIDQAACIDSEYAQFSKAIKRAEVLKIVEHTNKIATNIDRWQADAWLLERRWYKYFGANAQLNELNARMDKIEQGEADAGQLHHPKSQEAPQIQEDTSNTADGED